VVGINTFIAHNDSGAHANISLGSAAVANFLREHGMPMDIRAGQCRTATAGNTTAPPAAPSTPTPPAPATAPPKKSGSLLAPFESPFSITAGRAQAEIRKVCDTGRL
jgi:hypothetical protein